MRRVSGISYAWIDHIDFHKAPVMFPIMADCSTPAHFDGSSICDGACQDRLDIDDGSAIDGFQRCNLQA